MSADRPPASGTPVADGEADGLFQPLLGSAQRIGVAVSGGPDSTALLLLLDRWARATGRDLHVLTVDHQLRRESRAECELVSALADRLGRRARLLTWEHDGTPPAADVQAAARAARYGLLAEAARAAGLDAVALGHTLDDQAETFLIRLARGSGVQGLAGMPPERRIHGMRFVRPLLPIRKARLVATVAAAGITPVEDPSNASDAYLRSRLRALMPMLADVGLDAERLSDTARRLARAAAAIDRMVGELEATAATDHGGVFSVGTAAIAAAPDEVALRLLARLMGRVRPADYGPRAAALEAFQAALAAGGGGRRTLAGVTLDARPDRVWIYAEAGRAGFPVLPVAGPGILVWDGRFEVEVTADLPEGSVVAAAAGDERRPDLPKAAAATLPVLRVPTGSGSLRRLDTAAAASTVTIRPLRR